MEEPEAVVIQKRQAAIKLAKNMEPFNPDLGEEFDAIYVETLTEDIKQLAREMKKLAKVIAVSDQASAAMLIDPTKITASQAEFYKPLMVTVDGEEERVTKLMRRYCTRIQKMSDLIYEVAFLDFEQVEQDKLKFIMEDGADDDEED